MSEGWEAILHIRPVADQIEHEWSEECVCGPKVETTKSGVVMVTHDSLDGRELEEPDWKPEFE
jgi:hypothetical protein